MFVNNRYNNLYSLDVGVIMLKNLIPNIYISSIYDIDFERLKSKGITSLLIDLDNTLVEHNSDMLAPKLLKWISKMPDHGFKVLILSNNLKKRVSDIACKLGVPYICMARKPFPSSFRQALLQLNSTAHETAIIGDQLLTDVLGGNRLGLFTILVVPISQGDRWYTKLNRLVERIVFSYLHKRGYLPPKKSTRE